MAVITISRQFGSGGTEIARHLAKELSYQIIDKKQFADILKKFGLIHFDQVHDSLSGVWSLLDTDKVTIVEMLNKLILEYARRNNTIILGRGAFVVLGDYQDVFHIRFQAPFSVRVQNVMERENLSSYQEAEERVAIKDHVRENFIKTFYNVSVNSARNFDLIVNTGKIAPDLSIGLILDAIERGISKSFQGKALAEIAVDPVISKVVDDYKL